MSPDLLNLGAAALCALGVFVSLALCIPALHVAWSALKEDSRDKITAVLAFVFGPETDPVDTLALIIFGMAAVSCGMVMLGFQAPIIVMFLLLLGAMPVFFFFRASGQRARELELALPLALQQVANEMAAGATLEIALKKVAKTAPSPADIEIGRLQRRVEIMGIDEAFSEMARQLNSPSFTLTASVVRVGTSSGGRLIEALKSLSRTLIEIERLNKKLRTASENGRRNLYLMSFVGPAVVLASYLVVDHETSVMEDGFGQMLMGVAILSFFAAHVIGHTLTRVKV